MKKFDPSMREWFRIGVENPIKGSTVVAFTPVWGTLRFRVVGEDLLHTLSEATHWSPLAGPMDDESNLGAEV